MKGKKLSLLLAILLALSVGAVATACTEDQPTPKPDDPIDNPDKDKDDEEEVSIYMTEELTVKMYDSEAILYTVIGSEKSPVWVSANEAIAVVDANGVVSGVSVGETTITATIGSVSASCKVTVKKSDAYPTLVLKQTDAMPRVGGSVSLNADVRFNGALQQNVTFAWASENEAIATVSTDGVVTGVSAGKTNVVVSTTFNGVYLEEVIEITVVAVD